MSFIYLASPYSHESETIRHLRFKAVEKVTVYLLKARRWVYSPIVHCHELSVANRLPSDAAHWEDYNKCMLSSAHEMYILELPGWEKSKGVTMERAYARERNMPVNHIFPSAHGAADVASALYKLA